MSEEEADKLVPVVKGYFPQMTRIQEIGAKEELLKVEHTPALLVSLKTYVRMQSRFDLASFINAITPPAPPQPAPPAGNYVRTTEYREQQAARAATVEAGWQADLDLIAELDAETLAEETRIALASLDGPAAEFEKRRGVANSILLRGLVAEQVRAKRGN